MAFQPCMEWIAIKRKDLCSFIDALDENSFHVSSATSVKDTFQEIWDIFNALGEHGKTVAQTASIILEKANDKVYVLQEYNPYISDQRFKIVNFTGTKCSDKEMFSLFLQQSLDPLRREHWKSFCAKTGVEICSKKVSDLLYIWKLTWWFPPKKFAKQKQAVL